MESMELPTCRGSATTTTRRCERLSVDKHTLKLNGSSIHTIYCNFLIVFRPISIFEHKIFLPSNNQAQ